MAAERRYVHVNCAFVIVTFHLTAMDADQKFWADPNSYLQPSTDSSCGAHFILYNFTSLQPFNMEDLSHLRLAGVLYYKVSTVLQLEVIGYFAYQRVR